MKLPWQTRQPQGAESRPRMAMIQGNSPCSSGINTSSDHSSYNMELQQISRSDTNTIVENSKDREIVLMDINLDKTSVAYVTKKNDKCVKWELCISKLDTEPATAFNTEPKTVFNAKSTFAIDISNDICAKNIEDFTMFLSISPKGRKVAISFLPNRSNESTNGEAPKCIILKLSKNLGEIVRNDGIEFQ